MAENDTISYGLFENALDFILEAIERLGGRPEKRDLKYAVLHLHSGIELLLKERLRQKDWRLVFENLEKADENIYRQGNFNSVSWKTCINRLKDECDVDITDEQMSALSALKYKRNRLEHFGIIDSTSAIKSATIPVLSFALDFIANELHFEKLREEDEALLRGLRKKLEDFSEFVEQRHKEIEKELKEFGDPLECPACLQNALIIDIYDQCLFCGYKGESVDTAQACVQNILGLDWHYVADGGEWPVILCPSCEDEALVDLRDLQHLDQPRFICFGCGEKFDWDEVSFCMTCGLPYLKDDDDSGICDSCFDWMIKHND